MTETTKYKRRTFKDVEAAGYARGRAEGYLEGRKTLAQDLDLLLSHNKELQVRLGQGLWSRLTGLFKGGRNEL